ncbi:MAG: hypothetical protein JOZ69_16605 [Myxococcales bacterium]|nr:hypothetical protein [Myxococcales bacterium]
MTTQINSNGIRPGGIQISALPSDQKKPGEREADADRKIAQFADAKSRLAGAELQVSSAYKALQDAHNALATARAYLADVQAYYAASQREMHTALGRLPPAPTPKSEDQVVRLGDVVPKADGAIAHERAAAFATAPVESEEMKLFKISQEQIRRMHGGAPAPAPAKQETTASAEEKK